MTGRAALALGGAGMAAYGAFRLLNSARPAAIVSALTWFVGGALAHDALIGPAVLLTGAVLARWCPAGVRPYLQAGLIVTGGLTLVAIPVLTGRGYSPRIPSALPLDYPRGYLVAVAAVWTATLLIWAFRALRRRHVASRATTLPVRR